MRTLTAQTTRSLPLVTEIAQPVAPSNHRATHSRPHARIRGNDLVGNATLVRSSGKHRLGAA
jgi:hypothetical protein